jgi:alpha-1,2-rhamnosyltransferase
MRDAGDAELDYAYRHASALVIASQTEGFGLPIAEAFQRGLPVLCSDIPVFREVADGKARFFALGDPRHLANALSHFGQANAMPNPGQRVPQPWLTWRESTEELFSIALKLAAAANTGKPKEF